MALFTFRKGGDDATAKPATAESVEVIRKRAKHRLLGAAVLVLAGVVGFPLVFDGQPRPISVDIPIEIPDKAKVKPLAHAPDPQAASVSAPADSGVITETRAEAGIAKPVEGAVTAAAPLKAESALLTDSATVDKPISKSEPKADEKTEAKSEVKAESKAAPEGGRFVVQVGAYADPAKARDARLKVERAGMKTYTQDVQTKDGSRIRVRVGPFAGRAEADKAAAKIKKLDLAAAVLSL
jgi:DedD protein